MLHLAMLAEALTMVRGHDHESVPCLLLHCAKHLADGPVARGNLGLVRLAGKPRSKRGRRIIRSVGVVDMHPEKERALGGCQPLDGVAGDFRTATLQAW